MCGIFAYLNYNVSRQRSYILQVLFNGLRRLEYRGYDSSGIAIDSSRDSHSSSSYESLPPPLIFRQEGNIESLVKSVYQGPFIFSFVSVDCVLLHFPDLVAITSDQWSLNNAIGYFRGKLVLLLDQMLRGRLIVLDLERKMQLFFM